MDLQQITLQNSLGDQFPLRGDERFHLLSLHVARSNPDYFWGRAENEHAIIKIRSLCHDHQIVFPGVIPYLSVCQAFSNVQNMDIPSFLPLQSDRQIFVEKEIDHGASGSKE
ncbi:hypothetical protein QQ056_19195 [Oscillatoria laete-virens NRMC-F 0139]|nr:hypothetical protein [Oscillatoria laete-virens NRMC-F 0139]